MDIIYDKDSLDETLPKVPIKRNPDIYGERNYIEFISKEERDKLQQQEFINKKESLKLKEQTNIQHKKLYQNLKYERKDYSDRRKRSRSREKEFNKKKVNSEDKEI